MQRSDGTHAEFGRLYPGLDEREREQAEETFSRYLAVVLGIYERLSNDPDGRERVPSLTEPDAGATMAAQDGLP